MKKAAKENNMNIEKKIKETINRACYIRKIQIIKKAQKSKQKKYSLF